MPAFLSSSLALIMDPDDVSDFLGGFSGISSEGTTDSNNKVLLTTTTAAAAAAEATTTSSGKMGKLMQDEDDVTAIFRMPLSQACERLGATKEALKKQARTHGLSRWPSRRLLSVARVAKSLADYMDYLEETNADEKTKKLVAHASLCVSCEYKETQRETAYAAWKAARQQQRTPRAYLVYLEGLKLQVNSDTSPLVETISDDILREKFRSTLWKELQDARMFRHVDCS
ncbi:hypothetical protein NFJ02_01g41400 [Pycnococcus provasolii]